MTPTHTAVGYLVIGIGLALPWLAGCVSGHEHRAAQVSYASELSTSPVSSMCFGYHPTCWRPWPAECAPCPPPSASGMPVELIQPGLVPGLPDMLPIPGGGPLPLEGPDQPPSRLEAPQASSWQIGPPGFALLPGELRLPGESR